VTLPAASPTLAGRSALPLFLVGLAAMSYFAASMAQQAPGSIGPALTSSLHISRAQLGLLTSAIWGGMLVTTLPAGVLTDRFGERRIVAGGLVAMALLLIAAPLAGAFIGLLFMFLLASFAASCTMPGTTKAIASWAPLSFRASALGFGQAVGNVGAALSAAVLPGIAAAAGWGAAVRASTVPAILVALGFLFLYREKPGPPASSSRVTLPALLRNRQFILGTAFAFVNMGALATCSAYVALYLHQAAGYSAVAAGGLLALYQVGGMIGRFGWAYLSDRLRLREPVLAVIALLGAGSALAMVRLPGQGSLLAALVVFLLGLSTNGWSGLYLTIVADAVGLQAAGSAVGASLTISLAAMFVVAPAYGALVDHTSYALGWSTLAGWIALGLLAATGLALVRRRPAQPA
jgi:MFS transporter, ACS family, hexuronate transporter